MRRPLILLLLLAALAPARAAVPSFDSFVTNEFVISRSATLPWKIALNLNTNQFSTNSGIDGITITNVSGLIPQDLWTNFLGNYIPAQSQNQLTATNIQSAEVLTALGAFRLETSSSLILTNGVNEVNPYQLGRVLIQGATATPTDSTIQLDTGNGNGQIVVLLNSATNSSWCLLNGSPQADDPTRFIYLPGGDFCPTNRGQNIVLMSWEQGWVELGRSNPNTNIVTGDLWQVVGGTNLQPVNLALQPTVQNGWFVGTNSFLNWPGTLTNGEVLVAASFADLGDRPTRVIDLSSWQTTNFTGGFIGNLTVRTNQSALSISGSGVTTTLATSDSASGFAYLTSDYGITNLFRLGPTDSDGLTPYKLNTDRAHTSGNLLEVANNGTNLYQLGTSVFLVGTDTSHGSALTYFDANRSSMTLFGFNGETAIVAAGSSTLEFNLTDSLGRPLVTMQPMVGDPDTPFRQDTESAHTTGNLLEVANDGTNVVQVGPLGSLFVGPHANDSGQPNNGGMALLGWSDPSKGDPNDSEIFLSTFNSNTGASSTHDLFATQTQAAWGIDTATAFGATDYAISLHTTATSSRLILSSTGTVTTDLNPQGVTDVPNTPVYAYLLNTSVAITGATNRLVLAGNNGTEKFGVLPDGVLRGAESASAPSGASTYYHLFAIDNGGGKMVLKVQFPSGAAQVLATEP